VSLERFLTPENARTVVRAWQREGLTVGFVPTMGALHEGHLSLLRACATECDRAVLSIYVNPTQFGPNEDLEAYPRRLDEDCELAERAGANAVFCPTDKLMYPSGYATFVDQTGMTEVLEGLHRPGHFRGVLTVVCKLLNCVPAECAYFGQKDFQQTVVIRRMVADLNMGVEVRVQPTVREPDGLAMSSRNDYLDADQRRDALCLWRALQNVKKRYAAGENAAAAARQAMREVLAQVPQASPDYVDIVDCDTLERVDELTERAVAVLAVRLGGTRLIDNLPMAGDLPPGRAKN
jgi:pantoate--beta-alanine ligase